MAVTNKSFHQSEHMGHCFYFCGATCKARFVADPARYSGALEAVEVAPEPTASEPLPSTWNRGWVLLLLLAVLLALALGWFWRA